MDITIPARIDRADLEQRVRDLHGRQFNCAQSVICALGPAMGADEDTCFRLAEGLGGGLGGHTETCGALLGAAMVLGLARSNGCADPTSKKATYQLVIRLTEAFHAHYGTTTCSEIRAQDETGQLPLKVCTEAIVVAANIAADILEELANVE